ncbi:MAG: STAS domain-containing protein [Cyanobacteria bacterium P01_F01_bin.143]
MAIEEIKDQDYTVKYDSDSNIVDFIGLLSLQGPKEYAPITGLLNKIVESQPEKMTLNLKELSFLNSSGISMLSKFVLGLRKKKAIQLVILGSNEMPWQSKSLKNLQKFLPSLKLEID